MWPALFRIPIPEWFPEFLKPAGGYFPIRMFGVMVILGFLAGTWLASRRLAKRNIMTSEQTFDFCFYLLATGILGSRLCYVLQNFSDFEGRFFRIFAIWEGGLVWYGGMALATVFAFWWLWKHKLPVLVVTDAIAPGVALALAVGRWGCFFAGDDYGEFIRGADGNPITDAAQAPWYAVQFPVRGTTESWRFAYTETPPSHAAPYFLHPVQIYMSLKNLIVFGLLCVVGARAKRVGMITAAYLMLYPVARFVVERWRGDADRGLDVLDTGLSFSQFFGIFPFLIGVMVLRAAKSRPPETTPAK
ncbi:MAG: Prolipoprotein diacylglyceryl transferase [Planctomycetes bacterium]|nr:Prolipoprotein diacylglyceryl transferase [Planctomycetota bacterium]